MYKLLALTALVAIAAATQKCPANEEFQSCGTACSRTCANRNDGPRPCIAMCKQGCFCQKGFVRNSRGVCVREEQCEEQNCGANEVFTTCGTACPRTCANRNDNRPRPCPAICKIGCVCQKGFLKNKDGKCVKEEQCEGKTTIPLDPVKKCGANERFTSCGTACPLTCANRNNPPKVCTLQCVIGCACEQGFFKNADGKCVKQEDCEDVKKPAPKQCGKNEELVGCASTCPRTCANRNQGPIPCNRMCKLNSCECKKGFIRNGAGDCVKEEQCEQSCTGKNEVLTGCMAHCQPKCGLTEPRVCSYICMPGCICPKGFARDSNGQCVRREECPKPAVKREVAPKKCGENEELIGCASTCPRTCANRNQGPIPCNKMCKLNSCECKKGFIRNGAGRCVREDQCEATCTGKNEVLTGCLAHCQPKCGLAEPRACTKICMPGCICPKGLARNANGQCVRREECPKPTITSL